jgi:hypothetical protein
MTSIRDSLAVLNVNLKPSVDIPRPNGFDPTIVTEESATQTHVVTQTQASKILALKKKRAMEMAMAPGKNIFLTMFMVRFIYNVLYKSNTNSCKKKNESRCG